uniref:Intraflagellar transport protein 81 homolog n=1 Tax=Plectus sambesii TaxID=2011161 RepID=A0A914WSH3_9BILA
MADKMRAIVAALNEAPFSRNYNLISFDSLDPQRLLQELSDVLRVIDNQPSIDIRSENAADTAMRIFNTLRILKYKPPTDPEELAEWREGVVEGSKQAIYPVLEWLLPRVEELQQRSYLARFLVKVDIPGELQDVEVVNLINECDNLMEHFKMVHQEASAIRSDTMMTEDVRADLKAMDTEKEQLSRRIDKVQRKTENIPNREKHVQMAALLRDESEREAQLALQKQEQRTALVHAEQRLQRLQQAIGEARSAVEALQPEDVMRKLEEDIQIHSYLANDKLPKEIEAKRAIVHDLAKVASQPALDQSDIEQLKKLMEDTNEEIVKLTDERDSKDEAGDDKMSIYRHQAATVERKKTIIAQKLQEARQEMASAEQEVRERKSQMRDAEGNEIVTSVQFKNYVNKLRTKTNGYKKKRSELQDLRAELGVLARTEEILRSQFETVKLEIEEHGGTMLPAEDEPMKQQRPKTAKPESKDVNELKTMVDGLSSRLNDQKTSVAPLLSDLRIAREQFQSKSDAYTTKKQHYDATAASLESGYSRLDDEVKSMRDDSNANESAAFKLEVELKILRVLLERVEADARGDGKAFKDIIQDRIYQAEEESKKLQTESASFQGDNKEGAARQMKLWRDLMKVMEVKNSVMKQRLPSDMTTRAKSRMLAPTDLMRSFNAGSDVPIGDQRASGTLIKRPATRQGSAQSRMA